MSDTEHIKMIDEQLVLAGDGFVYPRKHFLQIIKEEIYRSNRKNQCFLWLEIPFQVTFGRQEKKSSKILEMWKISVQTILSEENMNIIGQGKDCLWSLYINKNLLFLEDIKKRIEERVRKAGLSEYFMYLNFTAYFYSGKSQSFVQEENRFIKKWNNESHFFKIKRFSIEDVKEKTFRGLYTRFLKRTIDIVGSLFCIVVFSLTMLICAILVKRALLKWASEQKKLGNNSVKHDSVIFKQVRIGRDGKPFRCYKFRTMYPGADKEKRELKKLQDAENGEINRGPTFKIDDDPRILKHGMAFMRKHSLDELPQFFNVLRGDMSLVGPRPPTPDEVREYAAWHYIRLSVKPGLTCFWQTSGRNDIDFDEWMRLDNKYIHNRSTLVDLNLKLKTVEVMLSGKGAS